MKRYREKRKSGKGTSAPVPEALAELQRLLYLVKNNLAKNNSALAVTRCAAEVFLIRRSDATGVKNSLAGAKVIVLQADPSG